MYTYSHYKSQGYSAQHLENKTVFVAHPPSQIQFVFKVVPNPPPAVKPKKKPKAKSFTKGPQF